VIREKNRVYDALNNSIELAGALKAF